MDGIKSKFIIIMNNTKNVFNMRSSSEDYIRIEHNIKVNIIIFSIFCSILKDSFYL
jgi:hypothetical protein